MININIQKLKNTNNLSLNIIILSLLSFYKKKKINLLSISFLEKNNENIFYPRISSNTNHFKSILKYFSTKILINKFNKYIFIFSNISFLEIYFLINILSSKFLIEPLIKNTTFILLKISIKNQIFYIKNFSTILPIKLNNINQIYKNYYFKNFDQNKYLKVIWLKKMKQIKTNQKLALKIILTKQNLNYQNFIFKVAIFLYYQYKLNFKSILSVSDLSFKIFRKNFLSEKIKIVKSTLVNDTFIRKSYFGGFTELFQPSSKKNYFYDINSQYPRVMLKKMPAGNGKWIDRIPFINIKNIFGFFDVEIESHKNLFVPVLPFRHIYSILTPVGKWRGVYFSKEIELAIKLNYKVKIYKGLKFKKQKIFYNYINHFYNLKSLSSTNSIIFHLSKLLLVSLYGRFAMKHFYEKFTIIKTKKELNFYIKNYKICYFKPLNKNSILLKYIDNQKTLLISRLNEIQTRQFKNTAIQISSAITAFSRLYFYNVKKIINKAMIYTDTDSIFTQVPLNINIQKNKLGYFKRLTNINYTIKKSYFPTISFFGFLINLNKKFIKRYINTKGLSRYKFSILFLNYLVFKNKNISNIFNLKLKSNELNFRFLKRKKLYSFYWPRTWIITRPLKLGEKNY